MSEPEVRASHDEPAPPLAATPRSSTLTGGEAVPPEATRGLGPRRDAVRLLVGSAALAFVAFGLPGMLDRFWLQIVTSVVIYSVVTLGLGLLIGRVGMVSLCQFALLAVGAWVALRLDYATSIPFPLLLLIAGVVWALRVKPEPLAAEGHAG